MTRYKSRGGGMDAGFSVRCAAAQDDATLSASFSSSALAHARAHAPHLRSRVHDHGFNNVIPTAISGGWRMKHSRRNRGSSAFTPLHSMYMRGAGRRDVDTRRDLPLLNGAHSLFVTRSGRCARCALHARSSSVRRAGHAVNLLDRLLQYARATRVTLFGTAAIRTSAGPNIT